MHFLRVPSAAVLALGVVLSPCAKAQQSSDILGAIFARGHLVCGINGGIPGFSYPDRQGVMRGLDADGCRSVAAAIFGDPDLLWVPHSYPGRSQHAPNEHLRALLLREALALMTGLHWDLGEAAPQGTTNYAA
ncbi:hypothetical protein HVPorG_02201 (plasmid) [Roseomonas mucosa]|jgi:ABC-type amino acid transport substrate-binding protein|uniref:hypothetical protein n=1 Tax=Roseomonas mucosa TaxID=207340 RepID=UPI002203CC80|nr:hypothetical protein [Roseomonas mucosa]QDJ12206.1 hypothetical protein HVPorG_02201 [Roseomonas mucosa]